MGFNPLKKKKGLFKKVKGMNPILGRKKDKARGEAAESMMTTENVKQQAGAGQINFTKTTGI